MTSLKQAIREKCKDCTYDPLVSGSYLHQIEACTVRSCALWPVRPLTTATILHNRTKANVKGIDIDALVDSLPDDDEEEIPDPVV